jgi:hypothetical protein
MHYEADRGYLVVAVNNKDTDYVACAETLAKSLRYWHPDAKICLVTDQEYNNNLFDYVRILPHQSNLDWKVDNDWQIFYTSPFHETVKLEADMLVASPIDHWWTLFRNRSVWISNSIRDHKNCISATRRYRKIFDQNHLPDVYNAITYWRFSREAEQFFNNIKNLFANWNSVQTQLKGGQNEIPNTDLAYAIACELQGREKFITPGSGPSMVHMKPAVLGTSAEDWSNELTWELHNGCVKINGYAQHGLVHYHQKHLAVAFGACYE